MDGSRLYSIAFELVADHDASVPPGIGRPVQAAFLNLVKQFDPALSARLHDEPGYRPFTVSPLREAKTTGKLVTRQRKRSYYLRITLFDGGTIWERLQKHFLEAGSVYVSIGRSELRLVRMLTTPATDPFGWADSAWWSALAATSPPYTYTLHFTSPTAFSLGERQFGLFPEPRFVWRSLLRTWNCYAPAHYRIENPRLEEFLSRHVKVVSCMLHTHMLRFPLYTQKGFIGTCTYQMEDSQPSAAEIASLTAFAPYAGIGYQTTMGMGQVAVQLVPSSVQQQNDMHISKKNADLPPVDHRMLNASESVAFVSERGDSARTTKSTTLYAS